MRRTVTKIYTISGRGTLKIKAKMNYPISTQVGNVVVIRTVENVYINLKNIRIQTVVTKTVLIKFLFWCQKTLIQKKLTPKRKCKKETLKVKEKLIFVIEKVVLGSPLTKGMALDVATYLLNEVRDIGSLKGT